MKGVKSHTNRAMYRGTTFNDGNIPKSINRKKKRPSKPQHNKYFNDDNDNDNDNDDTGDTNEPEIPSSASISTLLPNPHQDTIVQSEQTTVQQQVQQQQEEPEPQLTKEEKELFQEMKQVRRKIKNLQESIQLSVNIAQPGVWRDNCLNASAKIVNQWRSIVRFYGIDSNVDIDVNVDNNDDCMAVKTATAEGGDDDQDIDIATNKNVNCNGIPESNTEEEIQMDKEIHEDSPLNHPGKELIQATALQVFGILQMALQTGPLKGSNAGYFKRCGADVADMARLFLGQCIMGADTDDIEKESETDCKQGLVNAANDNDNENENANESDCDCERVMKELLFTMKQKEAIEKWCKDAQKAISTNKKPSKSAMKLQGSINTKGMSRTDKRRKGRLVKR